MRRYEQVTWYPAPHRKWHHMEDKKENVCDIYSTEANWSHKGKKS